MTTDPFRRTVTRGKVLRAWVRGGRVLADLQLLGGEVRTRVELLQPYGATAVPERGAGVVVFEVAGSRDHLVATMADDPALRLTALAPGEFGVRDRRGQAVAFRDDGVEVTGALKVTVVSSGPVVVQAPQIHLGGPGGRPVARQGDTDSRGDVIQASTTTVFAT